MSRRACVKSFRRSERRRPDSHARAFFPSCHSHLSRGHPYLSAEQQRSAKPSKERERCRAPHLDSEVAGKRTAIAASSVPR